jgi:hypothetical protein
MILILSLFFFVKIISQYCHSQIFVLWNILQGLLDISVLRFCPELLWQDMNVQTCKQKCRFLTLSSFIYTTPLNIIPLLNCSHSSGDAIQFIRTTIAVPLCFKPTSISLILYEQGNENYTKTTEVNLRGKERINSHDSWQSYQCIVGNSLEMKYRTRN